MLHLKTGLSYIENNNLLICGELSNNSLFDNFNKTIVEEDESDEKNSLWINDTVIVTENYKEND